MLAYLMAILPLNGYAAGSGAASAGHEPFPSRPADCESAPPVVPERAPVQASAVLSPPLMTVLWTVPPSGGVTDASSVASQLSSTVAALAAGASAPSRPPATASVLAAARTRVLSFTC